MFQPRGRQICSKVLKPPRQQAPTKVNSSMYNNDDKLQKQRKSKYNIPKNVRDDLENALVSLCDVWFEEIKPYLVNNNVKVHVHDYGSDVNVPMIDKTDVKRREVTGAPRCSHLDPGAAFDCHHRSGVSSAGSYSTRPVTSKMRLHKLPPLPPTPPSPLTPSSPPSSHPRYESPPPMPRPPPPSLRIPLLHLSQSPHKENMKKSARSEEKKKKRRPNSPIREHHISRLCCTKNITSDTMKLPKHY